MQIVVRKHNINSPLDVDGILAIVAEVVAGHVNVPREHAASTCDILAEFQRVAANLEAGIVDHPDIKEGALRPCLF